MELTVEIQSGPGLGKKVLLRPGKIVQVGRTSWADLSVPQDWSMSGIHFVLECGQNACRLRDQQSANGTSVNGVRVTESVIAAGDQIVAGQTIFLVKGAGQESPPAQPARQQAPPPAAETRSVAVQQPRDLLQHLRTMPEPLFALVDAARDPGQVLMLLQGCSEEHQSLYEGPKGEQLAASAPYLVHLPRESPFLEKLLQAGWGKSWGIYLTCNQPFKELRRHFRHFLLVSLPDAKEVYFRFYDPRVLRVFLPTCTPKEITEFFGPVNRFLIEAELPGTLLQLTDSGNGHKQVALAVAKGEPAAAK